MRLNKPPLFLALGFALAACLHAAFLPDENFQDLRSLPGVKIDLRYASTNNFMHLNLYGDFQIPYLHKRAALQLQKAASELQKQKPGWSLLVFDALRPRSVQQRLWDHVKGTPQEPYVANPQSGSIHNYGFAVDLSLVDRSGQEVDMGTPFDDFRDLAQPRHEARFLKEGRLTAEQVQHRQLLRGVMEKAGFIQQPNEWWHYDALPKREVKKYYRLIE